MNLYDLCRRDVVSLLTGENLGSVDDLSFDENSACISHVVIYGRAKLFGLLGREEDTYIPWSEIAKIGEDVILVTGENAPKAKKRKFF